MALKLTGPMSMERALAHTAAARAERELGVQQTALKEASLSTANMKAAFSTDTLQGIAEEALQENGVVYVVAASGKISLQTRNAVSHGADATSGDIPKSMPRNLEPVILGKHYAHELLTGQSLSVNVQNASIKQEFILPEQFAAMTPAESKQVTSRRPKDVIATITPASLASDRQNRRAG